MFDEKIYVTGIGIYTPYNSTINQRIINKLAQKSNMPFEQEKLSDILTNRHLKKIDMFSALAILAIKSAFDEAGIEGPQSDAGLIIGNVFGGWNYVEDGMYDLYKGDYSAINPYVATAWFPAAAQGEASILYGYGGYSKTISAGTLSSAFAIEYGMRLVREEKLKYACCGGAEAAVTPVILNAINVAYQPESFISDASIFFCMIKPTNKGFVNNYKFTIECLRISRDLDYCLVPYIQLESSITTLVLSEGFENLCINLKDKFLYTTDKILGQTYGAAFALDLYVAYQAILRNTGKAFIVRRGDDGQYASCLITTKN